MVIALFGDSCTGKATIAAALVQMLSAEIFSGKDYLKLAKETGMAAVRANIYFFNEQSQCMFLSVGLREIDHEWYEYRLRQAEQFSKNERWATRMNNKASITALMSSFGRAFHTENEDHPVFTDHLAKELMTPNDIQKGVIDKMYQSR